MTAPRTAPVLLLAVLWLIMPPQTSWAQRTIDLAPFGDFRSSIVIKTSDGMTRDVAPDAKAVTVKPGEYVVAKIADQPTRVTAPAGTGTAYQLPVTLTTVVESGTQIALGVVVRTGNGLLPRVDRSIYGGTIYVGLINTLDPVTTINLPAPVQVTVAGPVDSIKPAQPEFRATNTFLPVEVVARSPRHPVELKVSTGSDITETVVPISVFTPGVTVVASLPSIAGFGFETMDLTVQAQGIPDMEGMPVALYLQGGGGGFTPGSQLQLDKNGRAVAKLRSSGLSPNVVVAVVLDNGTTAQAPPIAYTWPIDWLVFAIGGGLAGAIVKQLTGTRRPWLAAIVVGVLLGFIAAGLYMLGVSTIQSIPTGIGGQLVVAVVAALTTLVGVALLPIPQE